MLFGHGLFGGLGGFASFFGLILQIGLVLIIGRFLWNMWQRRQSAPAYAGAPMLRDAGVSGSGFGVAPGGGAPSANIEITPADYDAFERLLGDIQAAYSNEDLNGLRQHLTPEMVSYFSEQLSENVSRGVVNKVSGVKLLQGDLAEAWRENGVDYASVAMRYALVDRFLDRTSGRLVDGSETPEEVTEVWTFMRAGGGRWLLSAIQQT
jgi:predicted lipid-binding transport protein (Tim44 family)